jgi:hypothetical protein
MRRITDLIAPCNCGYHAGVDLLRHGHRCRRHAQAERHKASVVNYYPLCRLLPHFDLTAAKPRPASSANKSHAPRSNPRRTGAVVF